VDFKTHRIPNLFLLVLSAALFGIDILFNHKFITVNLLAGACAFGFFYIVFWLHGGLGYGDVKYSGVIGYFLGPELIAQGLLYAVMLGLAWWCLGRLIFRWGIKRRFPFGPWLGCGAVAAILIHGELL
jgi:leader peptidase (prepilin peptidase)/N-methyltransferase